MSISFFVQLYTLIGLSALVLAIGLFVRRKRYFAQQKRTSMELSKYIKEINRNLLQYIEEEDGEPLLKDEPSTAPKKDTFVEINRIIRKVEVDLAKGEWEEAEKKLIEALAIGPDHPEVCKKLALIYLHQERYSKAETLYLQLVEQECKDASVYGNLAITLYAQQKTDPAIKAYERAIELEPDKAKRYMNLGQIYLEREDIKQALHYFQLALRKEPKNTDYLFVLARAYATAELYEQSLHTLDQILAIEPYNDDAKYEVERIRAKM